MSATAAFVYLTRTSIRNRAWWQLRRLAQPRYAVSALVGVGYFWLVFLRPGAGVGGGVPAAAGTASALTALFAMFVAYYWLAGGDRGALAFRPEEVQFLFTAPVSRRELVRYKLLRGQFAVLVSTLLWTVLVRRAEGGPPAVLRAAALWMLFSTLNLNRLGAALVHASVAAHGRAGRRLALVPLAVIAGAVGAVGWSVWRAWTPDAFGDPRAMLRALQAGVETAPGRWAVWPVALIVRPTMAASTLDWARAAWPALLVMLAHFAWVLRTDAAFEEAAVEASAERARAVERVRARREGRSGAAPQGSAARRLRLPLAPTGAPAVALLWKNTLAVLRTVRLPAVVAALVIVGLVFAFAAARSDVELATPSRLAGGVALLFAALGALFGPQVVRNDLRLDLAQLELLKTFPLAGRQVVVAEVAASTLALTAVQLVPLVLAWAVNLPDADFGGPGGRTLLLGALVLVLPPLNAVSLAVHNTAALLFPAWTRLGAQRGAGGVEVMGQGILVTVATMLSVALALAIPLAIAAGTVYGLEPHTGRTLAAIPAVLLGVAALAGELWVAVGWLGRTLDRLEPREGGSA